MVCGGHTCSETLYTTTCVKCKESEGEFFRQGLSHLPSQYDSLLLWSPSFSLWLMSGPHVFGSTRMTVQWWSSDSPMVVESCLPSGRVHVCKRLRELQSHRGGRELLEDRFVSSVTLFGSTIDPLVPDTHGRTTPFPVGFTRHLPHFSPIRLPPRPQFLFS